MTKPFLAAAALLALASCTAPFNAKVSRFQALPAPAGQTFVVRSSDPNLQGGLEFSQYAQLVSARMVQQGFQPAADPARADLVVKMSYHVDSGRERVQSSGFGGYGGYGGYGGLGFGGYGYGRGAFIYGFHDPFLFGGYNDVSSYTVYTSELDLRIDRADNGQRVFEGTAKAMSRDDDLPHLVPNLVEAMFTGFPGNSGETVKITIAPEPKR